MFDGKDLFFGALQARLNRFQLSGLGGKLTLLFFQGGCGRLKLRLQLSQTRIQFAQLALERQRTGARLLAAADRVAVIAGAVGPQEEQIRVLHAETFGDLVVLDQVARAQVRQQRRRRSGKAIRQADVVRKATDHAGLGTERRGLRLHRRIRVYEERGVAVQVGPQ